MDIPSRQGQVAALLQVAPVGIVTIDAGGACTFVDAAAAAMLGVDAAAIIGADLHTGFHHHRADGSPYPREDCPILQAMQHGRAARIDSEVVWRHDGRPLPVEYAVSPLPAAAGAVVALLDISARRQAELERDLLLQQEQSARLAAEQAQARLAFLADAGSAMAAARDDDEALRRLAELAVPVLGDACAIDLVAADGTLQRLATQPADAPAITATTTEGAALSVPLLARGRTVGQITVLETGSGRRYGAQDITRLEAVARLAAIMTDNARLHLEAREAESHRRRTGTAMRALAEASRAFSDVVLDHQRLLSSIARLATTVAGDAIIIHLIAADGRWLRPVAVHHARPAIATALRRLTRNSRLSVDDGLLGRVIHSGRPAMIAGATAADLDAVTGQPLLGAIAGFEPAGLICLPLRAGGRVLGTLTSLRDAASPPFAAEDATFLDDLAGRAALAVAQGRAYAAEQSARREAERARETEQFLAEASILLSSSLEYDRTLRRLVALAVPRLADCCLVHLLDAEGQITLAELACASPEKQAVLESFRAMPRPLDAAGSPMAVAIGSGQPQLVPEVGRHRRAADGKHIPAHLTGLAPRSLIVVPLVARGRTIGALSFVTAESGRRLSARDLVVTTGLARRASTAIENARLYRQAQEAAERTLRHAQRIERLAQAARRFAESSLDRGRLLGTVAQDLSAVTGDPCVVEIRPDGHEPETVVHHHDAAAAAQLRALLEAIGGPSRTPLSAQAAARGRPVLAVGSGAVVAEAVHPALRPFVEERSVQSVLVMPLVVRGRPLGTLSTWREPPAPPYDEDDIPFIEDVAARAALAIDNALRYDAEERARQAAEAATLHAAQLQAVTAELSAPRSPAEAAAIVVRAALVALGAAAGAVHVLSPSGSELELVAAEGYAAADLAGWQRLPVSSDSTTAVAIRSGEAAWLPATTAAAVPADGDPREPAGALAVVPVRFERRLIGVLNLRFAGAHAFDDADQTLLQALAGQCGQALERARLHEGERLALAEAEAERSRFAFLAEVSATLAGSLDYGATLARVAAITAESFATYCLIDVLDSGDQPRRVATAHHNPAHRPTMEALRAFPPRPEGQSISARVLRTGRAELVATVTPEFLETAVRGSGHAALVATLGPRSVMAAPLLSRDRREGVITFVRAGDAPPFTPADVTLAEEIGRRAATAIENARLYQTERAARAEAEAANRAKDEFLSVLSHELRTPLTSILGWARILRRSRRLDEETVQTALATIESSGRAQAQLVEDILDVSRIVTGRLRLEPSEVDPAMVLMAAAATVQPTAQAKGVDLTVIAPAGLATIRADAERLQQVVWNLLSNAVKFTPAGGLITLRLGRDDDSAVITVSDTGAGIASSFLPFVFDRFRQADASSTRHYGGLGLGLSIVRHITELHGGSVQAESGGEGLGARFTVRLPLAATRAAVAVRQAPPDGALPGALTGRRLLLVEDDEPARQMLTLALRDAGCDAITTSSAEEGFDAFIAAPPDALISDIAMPGEDGYSLISRVRAWEVALALRPTPALALTAYAGGAARERALKAGFDAYLAKPVTTDALLAAIAALLAGPTPNSTR